MTTQPCSMTTPASPLVSRRGGRACRRRRTIGQHKFQGVVHTEETAGIVAVARQRGGGPCRYSICFARSATRKRSGQFIDQHAERSGRGIVDDYLRARAGAAAKQLFATPNFLAVRDQAQHEAYPVALAMIGEMIAGVLAAPS